MAKYGEQLKLEVVQQYLSGRGGARKIGQERGLPASLIEQWIAHYRVHGVAGLQRKRVSYDAAFKLRVLERMWREHWSRQHAAAMFDIRCAGHIGRWERQYHAGGIDALAPRKRIPMTIEPPKPFTDPPTELSAADEQMTVEQLKKELVYLRAENAYLKKLDALIQQKRAAAQKQRKS